jgi:hypothetical protein
VQPGCSLYGLQHSNPVDIEVAYTNNSNNGDPASAGSFGTANDPMVGLRVGGVNVFGGGLALYSRGVKVGGVGVQRVRSGRWNYPRRDGRAGNQAEREDQRADS